MYNFGHKIDLPRFLHKNIYFRIIVYMIYCTGTVNE
jgi:hypothetical protein